MRQLTVSIVIIALAISTQLITASAVMEEGRAEARIIAVDHGEQLASQRERLQALPADQWSTADITQYQTLVLDMISAGKLAANYVRDEDLAETSDLVSLVDRGYLPYWPLNPFNNWEPVKVLSVDDPFSPGDIVFQESPPAYHSGSRYGDRWPQSFAMFVYGPDEHFASHGEIKVKPGREYTHWVTVPEGALFNRIFYVESANQVSARYERNSQSQAK